jgi:putative heme iron utilization protein
MTPDTDPALADIVPEALAFPAAFDSLLLATADAEGRPHASYAVHLAADGCFYVYVSGLAAHTRNLQARPEASVLFIEDEGRARQVFARKRYTCDCRAEPIARGAPEFEDVLGRFIEKHGGFMEMLKGLADFQLFRLVPERAVYVRGFGQAFELSGEHLGSVKHLRN